MNKEKRTEIFTRLRNENPTPETELEYSSPYELLVAVALSAQATDVSVNKATRKLFPVANTPEQMVAHYRAEAEAAQIDVATSLSSDATMMIGGEDADGTSFSFTATREEDVTQAQLSVARGLE